MSAQHHRVLIVGSTYQDHVMDVPQYPQEDQKLRADTYSVRRGGNGANTACVLGGSLQQPARHSLPFTLHTHYFGTFPSRERSKWALDDFNEHHVNYEGSVFIDDRQVHFPVAFVIQSLANQSRTIVNYRDLPGYSADQLIERLKAANNSPFNWIHFEGNYMTATHQSIEYLRHSIDDIIISVEIEKPQREGIELLIGKGDVVFFSRSYAMAHGFDEPVQFLASEFLCSRLRPTALAFVTWGDKGAAVRCPQNSGRDACYYRCLAYQVAIDGVVETTGAGDTFIAAIIQSNFLFDLRADPARCLAFGCYIAGLKCCQRGFNQIPWSLRDFEAFRETVAFIK